MMTFHYYNNYNILVSLIYNWLPKNGELLWLFFSIANSYPSKQLRNHSVVGEVNIERTAASNTNTYKLMSLS